MQDEHHYADAGGDDDDGECGHYEAPPPEEAASPEAGALSLLLSDRLIVGSPDLCDSDRSPHLEDFFLTVHYHVRGRLWFEYIQLCDDRTSTGMRFA